MLVDGRDEPSCVKIIRRRAAWGDDPKSQRRTRWRESTKFRAKRSRANKWCGAIEDPGDPTDPEECSEAFVFFRVLILSTALLPRATRPLGVVGEAHLSPPPRHRQPEAAPPAYPTKAHSLSLQDGSPLCAAAINRRACRWRHSMPTPLARVE